MGRKRKRRLPERIDERLALLVFVLGKFDDEMAFLAARPMKHDETDLGVNVVFRSAPCTWGEMPRADSPSQG